MNNPIRILLVDDSPYFLDVARDFLAMQESFEVAGEVRDGTNALEQAIQVQPNVILLDLNLGSESGMKLIPLLKERLPSTKIIVLTIQDGTGYRAAALEAGADGFVSKAQMTDELIAVIYQVAANGGSTGADASVMLINSGMNSSLLQLVEHSGDLIYRYEFAPRRGFAYINAAAVTVTGYTPEEHYADPDLGFKRVHPDDRPILEQAAQGKLDPRQPLTLRWVRKDGSVVWTEQRNVNVHNEAGELVAIEGVARDITARKQAESNLQESEQRFRATYEQAAVGIAHVALDGAWLRVNQKLCDIVGYERDELLVKTFQDITHPDDLETDLGFVRQVLADEIKTYSMEKRYIRRDGSLVWINLTVSLVRDSFGAPQYFISVVEDISARKQAEIALHHSETRLSSILAHAAEAVIVVNDDQRIESFNDAAQSIFGYAEAEILGKPLDVLMQKRFVEAHRNYMKEFAASAESGRMMGERGEITCVRRDGIEFLSEIGISKHVEGGRTLFTAIVQDVSGRKQAEEENRLLRSIVFGVGAARGLDEAIAFVLGQICEHTGWLMGEAWIPDPGGARIEPYPVWYDRTGGVEDFRQVSQQFSFAPGEGVPGEVWVSGKPLWVEDVQASLNFPRQSLAQKAGIQAAVGVPVLAGERVVMVLDFFLNAPRPEDRHMVGLISAVAAQLGLLIERKQAEEKIQEQLTELQQWYNVTLGRETRIIGLKHEVNELLQRLGEPIRYPSAES